MEFDESDLVVIIHHTDKEKSKYDDHYGIPWNSGMDALEGKVCYIVDGYDDFENGLIYHVANDFHSAWMSAHSMQKLEYNEF